MDQLMMSDLEVKIDLLIRKLQQLRADNKTLNHGLRTTQLNQANNHAHQAQICEKVKKIITELKEPCDG